jgi:hypothetical protein
MEQGIVYTIENRSDRGEVHHYHRKPEFRQMQNGAKSSDIAQLKSADKRNLVKVGSDYNSRFTIGMEIEKNQLSRGAVREYELLCGFERDGSCGYEAVTNILPLVNASTWRNKVYDMMHKASRIIEDANSPSDKRCGGHISLGVEGMDGSELMKLVRKNSGILYAIYRHRLQNPYCRFNIRMAEGRENWQGLPVGNSSKYHVCLNKGNVIEFRLPARFQSVKQMMRRYEMMYELVDFSVNNPNGSFKTFLKKCEPILMAMYDRDQAKVNEMMTLAVSFQKFINTGKVTEDIKPWLGFQEVPTSRW